MKFRYAEEKDIPLILQFIKELADYEKMLDEVIATEALLRNWPGLLSNAVAADSSGGVWTGISQALISIYHWEQSR